MSYRFRKSVKLAPGVRMNVGKRGLGLSAGPRGASYTVNTSGRKTASVGLPGTGLSYRSSLGASGNRSSRSAVARKAWLQLIGAGNRPPSLPISRNGTGAPLRVRNARRSVRALQALSRRSR